AVPPVAGAVRRGADPAVAADPAGHQPAGAARPGHGHQGAGAPDGHGLALGGWLTDSMSWRWVFFINLPIGILALIGVWLFIKDEAAYSPRPFDFLGFGAIVAFIGALQLMLDRGPSLDWLSSKEIWTDLIVAIIA